MLKMSTAFYSAVTFCNYNLITVKRAPAFCKIALSFTNSTVSYEIQQRITSMHYIVKSFEREVYCPLFKLIIVLKMSKYIHILYFYM